MLGLRAKHIQPFYDLDCLASIDAHAGHPESRSPSAEVLRADFEHGGEAAFSLHVIVRGRRGCALKYAASSGPA
jgi:hypothetical protein